VINVLGMWLILFAVLLGWGLAIVSLLQRLGGAAFRGSLSAFQTAWLGYAGLLALLQIAALVMPIAELATVLACMPAAIGYVVQRRAVMRRLRQMALRPKTSIAIAGLVFISACMAAYSACDVPRLYDTGLYHLQAVKWTAQYATVPGLANLHMRFGYNNSVHVFGAFTDTFWEGMAVHVVNGFLLALVLAQWFTEIFGARSARARYRQVFCMFTLPFLLAKIWTMEVASLSSDLPLAVFSFVLVLELVSLPRALDQRRFLLLAWLCAMGAVVVSTKISGMAFLVAPGLFALVVAWRTKLWRSMAVMVALPGAIIVGWLVRGVVMSGWLVYPVFGKLPVAWAVPAETAASDLGNIQSWARIFGKPPEEVFGHGFWHWFTPWLENFRTSREAILLIVAVALLAWRLSNEIRGARVVDSRAAWVATITCVLGIAQWFIGAPDLRYGAYLFWLVPATLLASMLGTAMRDMASRTLVFLMAIALTAWAGGLAFHMFARPKLWGRPPAPQRVETRWILSGPDTHVRVPVHGDQCFDEDLPCTPSSKQQLRDPRSLGRGFLP